MSGRAEVFGYSKMDQQSEEAYRVLRTNIQFCCTTPANGESKIKTITVTSSIPDEGKSTTAVNLAISMAKSGLKVLLIDADLRKPKKIKKIDIVHRIGLTNLIAGYEPITDAIIVTDVDNLSFINSGYMPLNPAELVGSEKFRAILNRLSESYDVVIIDTPPVGSVIDGAIIASQTDGTILVIKYNTANHTNIQRAKDQLEKVNARIMGVVLNMMKKGEYKNYYGYYN